MSPWHIIFVPKGPVLFMWGGGGDFFWELTVYDTVHTIATCLASCAVSRNISFQVTSTYTYLKSPISF